MDKVKGFALGMLTALGLVLILGAAPDSENGRYQVAAWGAGGDERTRSGYYVVDTRTGKVVDRGRE